MSAAVAGRRKARDAKAERICVAHAASPALAGSQIMMRARAAALPALVDSAAVTIACVAVSSFSSSSGGTVSASALLSNPST